MPRPEAPRPTTHHPHHLYLDDTWYLVSAATVGHAGFLRGEAPKTIVRDTLKALIQEFGITLRAWVLLDNHYHLLLRTRLGSNLPRFVHRLHGRTSRQINLPDGALGRQVWHNYWDACVRSETDLWVRFNYIHHNPVKHGYVADPRDWTYSSFHFYLRTRGEEWLRDCWLRYPAIDHIEGDGIRRA